MHLRMLSLLLLLLVLPAVAQDAAQNPPAPEPVRACHKTDPPGTDCIQICSKAEMQTGKSCVVVPRPISTPDPEYSDEARRNGVQGTIELWAVITVDGRVTRIKVARALGYGLDEKAMEAVRQWQFKPAIVDGKPVAFEVKIDVNFRLGNWGLSPIPRAPGRRP